MLAEAAPAARRAAPASASPGSRRLAAAPARRAAQPRRRPPSRHRRSRRRPRSARAAVPAAAAAPARAAASSRARWRARWPRSRTSRSSSVAGQRTRRPHHQARRRGWSPTAAPSRAAPLRPPPARARRRRSPAVTAGTGRSRSRACASAIAKRLSESTFTAPPLLRDGRDRHGRGRRRCASSSAAEDDQGLLQRPRRQGVRQGARPAFPTVNASWGGEQDPDPRRSATWEWRSRSPTASSRPWCATPTASTSSRSRARSRTSPRGRGTSKLKPEEFTGSDLHDLEPRHVRRDGVHRDHQPARERDPGGGRGAQGSRSWTDDQPASATA